MTEEPIDVDFEEPLAAPARKPQAELAPIVPFREKKRKRGGGTGEPLRIVADGARLLPHSIEAEEHLLSSCLIDGEDVIARCIQTHIKPESFYDPKHAIIYQHLLALYLRQVPIETGVLAEELKRSRQLDAVGGFPFLLQVSSRAPTTGKSNYYIERVHEHAVLREVIRTHASIVENAYNYQGDLEEFISDIETYTAEVNAEAMVKPPVYARGILDHSVPAALDGSVLLGKNRYLCRGGSLITVGPSGMGKTSISLQEPILYALGQPFMGIQPNGALSTLIIQAEDDEGDIGEVVRSVCAGMGLTDEQRKLVNERVKIIRDNVNAGHAFLRKLSEYVEQYPCDIVRLNPLTSFFDGDLSQQKDLMPFLKGLNRVNVGERFAYMIEHHTTKPSAAKEKGGAKSWTEAMYNMAGSSVLVNWARAIRTLEPLNVQGEFRLRLAKRGTRAGVIVEVESGLEGHVERQVTCDIYMRHSKRRMRISEAGKNVDVPMIFWESSDREAGKGDGEEGGDKPRRQAGGRRQLFTDEEVLKLFPRGHANRATITVIIRKAREHLGSGLKETTFYEYRSRFIAGGSIAKDDRDGKYYIPLPDDFRV